MTHRTTPEVTGVSMHALAYHQLTGQAGAMQQLGLVFNMGGAAAANDASVLLADRR